jgi:hypothetical protein
MHKRVRLLGDAAHLNISPPHHPYHGGQIGLDLFERVLCNVGLERERDVVDVRLQQVVVELDLRVGKGRGGDGDGWDVCEGAGVCESEDEGGGEGERRERGWG